MRVDSIEIAGMYGIEVPDGTQIDSEFVLAVRVRVFELRRDEVDVVGYARDGGYQPTTLPGALHAKLIALDGAVADSRQDGAT